MSSTTMKSRYKSKYQRNQTTCTMYLGKVPRALRSMFAAECRRRDTTMVAEILGFMKAFVDHGRLATVEDARRAQKTLDMSRRR